MKKSFAKALTVAGIAGALALTPTAALAYAPTPTGDSVTAAIGAPVTIVFDPIFTPGETVELSLTGINGASQGLASAGAISTATATTEATAAGSADATVTLNSDASGSYQLVATGSQSGATDEVTITVASTGGGAGSDDDGLAATGVDTAALGLWVGGGALLLGGGAVLVSRSVRKQKAQA